MPRARHDRLGLVPVSAASAQRGYYGGYDRGYAYDRGYRDDRVYRGDRGYYRDRGYARRCNDGTTGTVLGAIAGGLLGRTIDTRGDRTLGTVLGAGAGALAAARSSARIAPAIAGKR